LSPTPPVECLSAMKSYESRRCHCSPERSMACVSVAISSGIMPLMATAISSADI
jgi:hypothetical protein